MRFTVYTLFPNMLTGYFQEALLARALATGRLSVELRDLRRFAGNRTGRVDDAPYGGGAGMVMRVDVAGAAIDELALDAGQPLTQRIVEELATLPHVALISGRYEGFDARVEQLVTRELSIGDYVLMGGELPALVLIEAVARLLPGVLGDADSHRQESFSAGLLDYPEFTRPASYRGLEVPEVLLSGHHAKVSAYRREAALRRTFERRAELLKSAPLSDEERAAVLELLDYQGRDVEVGGGVHH